MFKCQPCRDRRQMKERGEVPSAWLCEDCKVRRRAGDTTRPKRVRKPRPSHLKYPFLCDQLHIDMVADGLIRPERVHAIERREAAKILIMRGRMERGEIAKRSGVSYRNIERLFGQFQDGTLTLRETYVP